MSPLSSQLPVTILIEEPLAIEVEGGEQLLADVYPVDVANRVEHLVFVNVVQIILIHKRRRRPLCLLSETIYPQLALLSVKDSFVKQHVRMEIVEGEAIGLGVAYLANGGRDLFHPDDSGLGVCERDLEWVKQIAS